MLPFEEDKGGMSKELIHIKLEDNLEEDMMECCGDIMEAAGHRDKAAMMEAMMNFHYMMKMHEAKEMKPNKPKMEKRSMDDLLREKFDGY